MLYLEDYLEMIEHLPQELRDRFTEMREMDLSVQNNMDPLDKRVRLLFGQCRRDEITPTEANGEFLSIRKDYYKILEDADEKVQLASQMYDLVDRYLRRLDSELFKFKCELEADNNGITEVLEKRSLELDGVSSSGNTSNQKENRYLGLLSNNSSQQKNIERKYNTYKHKQEKQRDIMVSGNSEKRQVITTGISTTPVVRPITPNLNHHAIIPTTPTAAVSYSLQHIGAGNAIAAAASQAIAATQQLQQGRRTASLKASYEAIHGNSGTTAAELMIGRELAGATHNAIQAVEREGTSFSNQRRQKKKLSLSTTSSSSQGSSSGLIPTITNQTMPQTPETPSVVLNDGIIT